MTQLLLQHPKQTKETTLLCARQNIFSENKGACDRLFKAKHGLCNGQDHEALLQEKS